MDTRSIEGTAQIAVENMLLNRKVPVIGWILFIKF